MFCCPVGAHFAPPFAILSMHNVEKEALRIFKEKFNFTPLAYKRYIDNSIIGPLQKNDFTEDVLKVFNSTNNNIQFTMEVPRESLNFLEINIFIDNQQISYSWYSKPCHSYKTLRNDS